MFGKWFSWWQEKRPNVHTRGIVKAPAKARKRKRKIKQLQQQLAEEQEKLEKAEAKIDVARETLRRHYEQIVVLEEQLEEAKQKLVNGPRCVSCEAKVGRCIICSEDVAVYINEACSHQFLCQKCHDQRDERLNLCPICRCEIDTLRRIYPC